MATNIWVELPIEPGGGGSGVTSFNGRTGAVLPLAGDYTAAQITNVPAGNITAINVQTALNQLDSIKQATITGAASTITTSNLTANLALISNGAGKVATSVTTATELSFVSGVTSSIQTQLNAKGTGTVTSVALALPVSVFTISGSPVTTTGTLTGSFNTQAANIIFAGPTTGAAAIPTFRSLVAADLNTIIVPIANGGTNSSTALNNNRLMRSSAGAIIEAAALINGQLFIGSTGATPNPSTLTAGPGITITNAAGSITITNSSIGVGTLTPGLIGDGVDGAVTISVNTTLTRDMYYSSLTVNAGVTLNTGGFVIFCDGPVNVAATGFIARNGNPGGNAATSSAGGAAGAIAGVTTGTGAAGAAGGAGTIAAGASGASSAAQSGEGGSGGVGGNGGVGSGGVGGSGGNSGALTIRYFRNVQATWKYTAVGTYMPLGTGGAGGAAGGGDGTNLGRGGGGGGSSAGGVMIICDSLNNLGTIQVKGGSGGNGGAGALGNIGGGAGGGGGGGGTIIIFCNTITNLGTLDDSGGTAGTGSAGAGTGSAGTNGSAGSPGYSTTYVASTNTWTTTQ